jgi:signal transduction histidine kinase
MELKRRHHLVFGLLTGAWLLVAGWQVEEHFRIVESAKSDLRGGSREIASTLSAVTRALQFRGAIGEERLDTVLSEMARIRTNALVKSSSLIAVGLLNTEGDPVVASGNTNLISREVVGEDERWSDNYVTFVLPVEGASVSAAGVTNNPTFLLPPRRFLTNAPPRGDRNVPRREPPPEGTDTTNALQGSATNISQPPTNVEPPPPPLEGGDRPREGGHRPPWLRWISEADFKAYAAKHELHGLVLVMSTENYRAICARDWWLRGIITFFAGISALGAGLAWRNMARTADLQIRLVRASEQNAHLKELNLAGAGLAHETRNPLNIIRGQAQMLARQSDASRNVQEISHIIMGETDKVTAQLTEFINYSRPRDVRRGRVSTAHVAAEVVRALSFDIEEKKLNVQVACEPFMVEADEQLLRQVLFNLLLNAIQAAIENGIIQVVLTRADKHMAMLEVRDDGPGVPPENRREIFKPYFTTHQKGTGLGLAVVQQIVFAHGWEIECVPNTPRGAVFRITNLKISP